MNQARLQGFGLLLVMAAAWGFNWPVMKALMLEWPPWFFRVLAGGGAISLMLLIGAAQGDRLLPPRGQWRRVAIAGLLNVSAWSAVAPLSLFWLDAAEAAIIANTMPVWATLLAWPLLGEKPGWRRIAGLVLGLSGVTLLLGGQLAGAPAGLLVEKLPGVLAISATALMFASGAIFTKRYPVAMPPVPLVAWQLVFGLLPVVAITLAFETPDFSRVTILGWGCLVYVGAIAQCLAYLAWFGALRRLPAGTATIGSLLVPIIGVVSSGLLLHEPLGLRHLGALALTLAGVALASRG